VNVRDVSSSDPGRCPTLGAPAPSRRRAARLASAKLLHRILDENPRSCPWSRQPDAFASDGHAQARPAHVDLEEVVDRTANGQVDQQTGVLQADGHVVPLHRQPDVSSGGAHELELDHRLARWEGFPVARQVCG